MQEFLTPSSFWTPEYLAETTAWAHHTPFAFWLMDVLRPATLVELGTHYGQSYFAFNQALRQLNVRCHCSAVDTWKGDVHAGFYGDEVFDTVNEYNRAQYSDFSDLLRMTFDEAVDHFEDNSIDLLHIDGRHFYDDVKHDFETWLPKLSNRAVVLLHDTNVCSHSFGVFRLWDELKPHYPHFEFLVGHGLGVLLVGKQTPGVELDSFFAASADESVADLIRIAYGRLGASVAERVEVQNASVGLQDDRAELRAALSELSVKHQNLSEEYSKLIAIRDDFDQRHKALDALYQNAQQQLQGISGELAHLTAEHNLTKSALEQSTVRLQEASGIVQQVEAAKEEASRLNVLLQTREAELARLQLIEVEFNRPQQIAAEQPVEDIVEDEAFANYETLLQDQDALREKLEILHRQLESAALLGRQQNLVVRRLQLSLNVQSHAFLTAREGEQHQAEICRIARAESASALNRYRATLAELKSVKEQLEKQTQLTNEIAGLLIPVWVRKLLPIGLRNSMRALKRGNRVPAQGRS